MTSLGQIGTIARWEIKRSLGTMGKGVLPIAILLLILLLAVTGFTAKSGLHIQDGIYHIGVDDSGLGGVLASDSRFSVYQQDGSSLFRNRDSFDIIIFRNEVFVHDTDRGRAALQTLQRDYDRYVNVVYSSQEDLFAAYPLWIDTQTVKSELDFSATQSGSRVIAPVRKGQQPVPEGPILEIPTPGAGISLTSEELRTGLIESQQADSQVSRYTEYFSGDSPLGNFKTPSQLSPPLPFDSIILIFVFIFPLYFTSQFYMMGIMNERIERQGEPLLSAPVRPWVIVAGKALPYFIGMIGISLLICLWIRASPVMLLPLFSIILFFLANALIIGMVSRSFKELSFISIFFSTLATSYLFFPSIFANVHIISLVSPLTLMILTLQGEPYTASQYLFSTSLFFLTSAVLFYIGVVNYREETLFSQGRLLSRIREFVSTSLSAAHPYLSLFAIGVFVVPFVFMAQMMVLVLFFNLPMPLSLVLLLVAAAAIEEIAKSIGIYALYIKDPAFFSWKRIVLASAVIAAAFLFGEKLLLLVTLTQISESVFGSVLFTSLGVLYLPFLLHFTGVLIVSAGLKIRGMTGYIAGLLLATVVHCGYNLYFILRWLG